MLDNSTVKLLPSSKNILSPISQETTLAFSVPNDHAEDFLNSVQQLDANGQTVQDGVNNADGTLSRGKKVWVMSILREDMSGTHRGLKGRVYAAWTAFVDLLKVCCANITTNS